jgi:hypothetical protein
MFFSTSFVVILTFLCALMVASRPQQQQEQQQPFLSKVQQKMSGAVSPPCAQIPSRTARCLVAFRYSLEQNTQICEVQYLDVPADAPKGDRYAWWLYHGDNGGDSATTAIRKQLLFQSMDGMKRSFQDGSRLDMELLVYVDSEGAEHALIEIS